MYVCVCNAVTSAEVEQAIDGGAESREQVTAACRAGGDCGSCHAMIEEMIAERCPKRRLAVLGGHAA